MPPTIDTSGLDEVVFSRIDGFPNEAGTITVLSSATSRYREISVDANGVITVSAPKTVVAGSSGGTTGGTTSGTTGGTTSGTTGGDTSGTTGGTTSGTTGGTTSGTTGGTTSGTTGGTTSGTTGGTTGGTVSGTTGGGTSGGEDDDDDEDDDEDDDDGGDDEDEDHDGDPNNDGDEDDHDEDDHGGSGGDGYSCATRYELHGKSGLVSAGTNDVNIKVLGSDITYGAGGPRIPVRVSASFVNGAEWTDLFDGRNVTGGEQQTFTNVSHNTPISLKFNGRYSWLFNKTYRSDVNDGHVLILRKGDNVPSYQPFANQQNLEVYIRNLISNGKINIGEKSVGTSIFFMMDNFAVTICSL
jgi:hypothetical protein